MIAARLYGPRDLRVEDIPGPGSPGRGEVVVRVTASGICGSDLHSYLHGRIGDTEVKTPLVLGHECAGVIEACGADAMDGNGDPLAAGAHVAIDPATPCSVCALCRAGQPHLCTDLHFFGLHPDDGSFRESLVCRDRSCFPLPRDLDDAEGALLEPLGVAMHAVDLAGVVEGASIALFGAGPIGLLILQLAKLRGAHPVYVAEPLPGRLALAERFGGVPLRPEEGDPVSEIQRLTHGHGVNIAVEAAWAGAAVQQAAESVVPGGRVVLVGIPGDDEFRLRHSTARRKELRFVFSRRMKGTYPGAIRLVQEHSVDVASLVSHRFPLADLPRAMALNASYQDGVVKVIIKS